MNRQEICFTASQASLLQQLLSVLSDAPPRQQALMERASLALKSTAWEVLVGHRQREQLALYGATVQQFNHMPWLAKWLLGRSQLSVLVVDGEEENTEASMNALIATLADYPAHQPLAILVHARRTPDPKQMARCYAILRRLERSGVVEWLDLFNTSPEKIIQLMKPANAEPGYLVA